MNKRKKRRLLWIGSLLILLGIGCGVYFGTYYRAGAKARAAMLSGDGVQVETAPFGYLFDGPGSSDALIFYPGAKVECTAYAPLLRALAERGIDCFLVRMPLHMAFFRMNAAADIQKAYAYDRWYLAGHSLGGACAALYAADHPDRLKGLVLLAAYATRPLDEGLAVLELHGSEDLVLNRTALEKGRKYLPTAAVSEELPGGNHAQFGDYGPQKGDGVPTVSRAEQTEWAAERIGAFLLSE